MRLTGRAAWHRNDSMEQALLATIEIIPHAPLCTQHSDVSHGDAQDFCNVSKKLATRSSVPGADPEYDCSMRQQAAKFEVSRGDIFRLPHGQQQI